MQMERQQTTTTQIKTYTSYIFTNYLVPSSIARNDFTA